ncbi:hypothetical protein KAS08_05630 [Candidatus Pacearchaeota archaeon]|nr:hypothetical protein [Candidatus Pacearchaeota archaeon]
MVDLAWCKRQVRGISLIEEKKHLSESYLKESWDSFQTCLKIEGKWRVVTGYYSCYNAFYSVLMRCGIKSEIHDCSIKLMSLFDFIDEDILFIQKLKKKRINAQYYLKEVKLEEINKVKSFVSKCERILEDLNNEKIKEIREKLR